MWLSSFCLLSGRRDHSCAAQDHCQLLTFNENCRGWTLTVSLLRAMSRDSLTEPVQPCAQAGGQEEPALPAQARITHAHQRGRPTRSSAHRAVPAASPHVSRAGPRPSETRGGCRHNSALSPTAVPIPTRREPERGLEHTGTGEAGTARQRGCVVAAPGPAPVPMAAARPGGHGAQ